MEDYIKATGYPDERGRVAFAIVINKWDTVNNVYDYALRMNVTGPDAEVSSPQIDPKTMDFTISVRDQEMDTYSHLGWLDWQYHIDQTIRKPHIPPFYMPYLLIHYSSYLICYMVMVSDNG